MEINIFLILTIVLFTLIILIKKDNSKLSSSKSIAESDLEAKEFDLLSEDASLEYLHKELTKTVNKLEKQLKNNNKKIEITLNYLKEKISDIETVVMAESCLNNDFFNLKDNLFSLVKMLKKSKKIDVDLILSDKLDNDFWYDNFKLMSLLRYVIKKSFEKGTKKMSLIVEFNENENGKKIIFKLENIKFVNEQSIYTIDDIYSYLSIEHCSPEVLLFNLEPEFLIIRQNLLNITKQVSFSTKNNEDEMTFEIDV